MKAVSFAHSISDSTSKRSRASSALRLGGDHEEGNFPGQQGSLGSIRVDGQHAVQSDLGGRCGDRGACYRLPDLVSIEPRIRSRRVKARGGGETAAEERSV